MEAQLTEFMKAMSALGSFAGYCVVTSLLVGFLIWRGRRHMAVALMLVHIGDVLNPTIKDLVRRPRPTGQALVHVMGYSFPSGHALAAAAFYGLLIYIVATRQVPYKKAIIGALVVLIGLIGYSRVYLGVHWPTDVLGGYLLGAIWLAVFIPMARRYRLI